MSESALEPTSDPEWPDPGSEPTAVGDADSGGQRTDPPGVVDVLILAALVALCVAHGYGLLVFGSYTPRVAILLSAGLPGLVVVARLARSGNAASRWALTLAAWVIVASAFTGAPSLALKGTIGREASGLIVILCIGLWGVGRSSSESVVRNAPAVLLAGLAANAAVGFVQVFAGVTTGPFAMQFDRATGLTPNPVYFGALAAAGAAVSAGLGAWRLPYRLGAIALFAGAVDLSGSRVALIAGFVGVAIWPLVCRVGWWITLASFLAYVGGVAGSTLATSRWAGSATSTDRLANAGGGGRFDAWKYGADAVLERPIAGWGFGRFRAATQGRFSEDFVRNSAFDDLTQAWFDAHNIVLGVAVSVGLVGLLVVAAWLVAACRSISGPLVSALVVFGIVLLLQPAGLVVVPLACLLLGLAADHDRPPRRATVSLPALLMLLAGVALAAYLVIGDLRLETAIRSGDSQRLEASAAMFPNDSVVADLVAQSWYYDVLLGEPAEDEFRDWSERAIAAEPDRPYYRSVYALRLLELGDLGEAQRSAEEAIALQPHHVGAWVALRQIGIRLGDSDLAGRALERLCPTSGSGGLLRPDSCQS